MKPYDDLFDDYVRELRAARKQALDWWDGLIAKESRDATVAYANVRTRWPAGPVSYPGVIAVYRKYFLAIEALNDQIQDERDSATSHAGWGEDDEETPAIVEPSALLLEDLEAVDVELRDFMSGFVFSPIGTDTDGLTA